MANGVSGPLVLERYNRWKDSVRAFLRENCKPDELRKFDRNQGEFLHESFEAKRAYLDALVETIAHEPHLVLRESAPTELGEQSPVQRLVPKTRRVFVVHGRDQANVALLVKLLKDRYHLEPVVLILEAGKGRTIMEKFEQEAGTCAFAFVLLSPDDEVHVKAQEGPEEVYAQPRPNTTFELGWFFGRLGRDRVLILRKSDAKIHSDLEGI